MTPPPPSPSTTGGDDGRWTVFFESYFRSFDDYADGDRLALYDAFFRYTFDGREPEGLTKEARRVWTLLAPMIDARKKKQRAGALGGKASGERRKNRSKTEAELKQTRSKNEANAKQNPSKNEANAKQKASSIENREKSIEDREKAANAANARPRACEAEAVVATAAQDMKKEDTPLKTDDLAPPTKTPHDMARELLHAVSVLFPNTKRRFTIETEGMIERRQLYARSEDILANARAWLATHEWTKEGGRYAPSVHGFFENGYYLAPPRPEAINGEGRDDDRRERRRREIAEDIARANAAKKKEVRAQ